MNNEVLVKNSKFVKIVLMICGAVFILVGFFSLVFPIEFTARNNANIIGNINFLNDYRGVGGLMIGNGLLILLGFFRPSYTRMSLYVASFTFLAFSFGRIISVLVDGVPVENLLKATAIELILGFFAVVALKKYNLVEGN